MNMPRFHMRAHGYIRLAAIAIVLIFLVGMLSNKSRSYRDDAVHVSYSDDPTTRYIQYECVKRDQCGGWADRLKGLLSSYALAVLMNRSFLIEMNKPCDLANFLRPNLVNWDAKIQSPSVHGSRKLTEHFLPIVYGFEYILQYELITVPELFSLDDYDLIRIKAAIMFSDGFSRNERFYQRLKSLGYEPNDFYVLKRIHQWYNDLFKLAPSLEIKYQTLLSSARPNRETTLICTQIRIGQKTGGNHRDYFFMPRDDTIKYWRFIADEIIRKNNLVGRYRLFVTSDYEDVKEEAARAFGASNVVFNKNSSVHVEVDNTCDNFDNVILDFHMMQNCDYMVVSHSGFGILGACNRPNPNKNLYVYTQTNQSVLREDVWNRSSLAFMKISDIVNDIYFI